jgi:CrcB protein
MNTRTLPARPSPGEIERTLGRRAAGVLSRLSVGQARIAAILAGGAIGTLARAGLAEALPHRAGQWPWATFIVNLVGAFILGWLLTRLAERTAPSRHWRFFAGTGFCGALTTFSTFQIETFDFARDGHVGLAVAYPVASIAAGMALAVAGVLIARWGRHW